MEIVDIGLSIINKERNQQEDNENTCYIISKLYPLQKIIKLKLEQ